MAAYAELHCHTHFSFLDGASAPDELVGRAVELGLSGLAVTDHNGLYGVVRFAAAAQEAGLRPVIGVEIELADAAAPDPAGVVVPARRPGRAGRGVGSGGHSPGAAVAAARGGRARRRGAAGPAAPGPRPAAGPSRPREGGPAWRRRGAARPAPGPAGPERDGLSQPLPPRQPGESRRNEVDAALHPRAAGRAHRRAGGALRAAAKARSPGGCGPAIGRGRGRRRNATRGSSAGRRRRCRPRPEPSADSPATAAFFLELQHHLLPDDDWLVAETARLAAELGLPVVVTNDVHYAYPEGREMQDVLTAIRHGRTLDELRDLRRPDGESYLKSGEELMASPP